MLFRDREHAGRELAERLAAGSEVVGQPLVLGLPRGGVPVAAPVARALRAPLDVLVVRKLGLPGHSELAMGAVAAGGVRVLNEEIIRAFGTDPNTVEAVAERELEELRRREALYRGGRGDLELAGSEVVIVDDGLATGATVRVAISAVREAGVDRVIVAVPVAAPDVCDAIGRLADAIVCLRTEQPFEAVGKWYREFPQTSDEEVKEILAESVRG